MKQRTIEWHQQRLGKFTGSEIYKLMGVKGLGKTGETYIYEKIAEELTGESKEMPQTTAMKWGVELEQMAKEYYEIAFDCKVKDIALYKSKKYPEHVGASPDGEVNSEYGIEIKCPYDSANHVKYMDIKNASDLKKIKNEYYWQIVLNLHCSGLKYWKFISFDPRFTGALRMYVVEITPPEEDFKLLEKRLEEAIEMKIKIIENIEKLQND